VRGAISRVLHMEGVGGSANDNPISEKVGLAERYEMSTIWQLSTQLNDAHIQHLAACKSSFLTIFSTLRHLLRFQLASIGHRVLLLLLTPLAFDFLCLQCSNRICQSTVNLADPDAAKVRGKYDAFMEHGGIIDLYKYLPHRSPFSPTSFLCCSFART
jgi:hypothetical protein